jgi:hypothetical protein
MLPLVPSMADLLVKGGAEARFTLDEERSELILEQLTAASAASKQQLRLLIIVAHPDDEAIGAGGLLRRYPGAIIAHLTDGPNMRLHVAPKYSQRCVW